MLKIPTREAVMARLREIGKRKAAMGQGVVTNDANPVPASLVRSAKAASWIAFFCLAYFTWMYSVDIARDRAAPLHLTHAGLWVASGDGLEFWFPLIVGFAVISIGIPYVAKIAIPTFMSLSWHDNAWPKGWSLFIALAVSLVVFAASFTIQGDAILEKGRDAAVKVAEVEQGKAVLEAQISAKEAELKSMMENKNAYLAQAASVGAAEWQRSYINATEANDPQRDRIVRALGAARAADAIRSDLRGLRERAGSATTTAAVSERVETRAGVSWIGQAIDYIQGIRAILLSLVMDIVALLMPWIALRLGQARNRGVAMSYDNTIAIEDHSAEAPLEVQPYERPKEQKSRVWDNDEQVWKYKRDAHYAKIPLRKSGKKVKGKNGKMVPDETLYEPAAQRSTVNAAYPEMETVEVEEPDGEGTELLVANSDVRARDGVSEPAERLAAGVDSVAADHDSGQPVESDLPHEEDASAPEAHEADSDGGDIPVAPALVPDALADEMIARGTMREDDEGFLHRVDLEETPPILPVDDNAPRYPQLPKPNGLGHFN